MQDMVQFLWTAKFLNLLWICVEIYYSETGTVIVLENSGGPLGIHVVPGVDKFGR